METHTLQVGTLGTDHPYSSYGQPVLIVNGIASNKMIAYKLTKPDMTTFGGTLWKLNETKTATGGGNLYGPSWLHAYEHPLLAVLHNPLHSNLQKGFLLFKARLGGQIKKDGQMQLGATALTLVQRMKVPKITEEQRVRYAIGAALSVYHDGAFFSWANCWLEGKDRSPAAAASHRAAAFEAAYAAASADADAAVVAYAYAAAYAAANAAHAAYAYAAYAAADAAAHAAVYAAYAAAAANAASDATYAAASAAAYTAASAHAANQKIDLLKIAKWAMTKQGWSKV